MYQLLNAAKIEKNLSTIVENHVGEKARFGRNEAHFAGAAQKNARAGVSEGCGGKCHPGSAPATLANFRQRDLDVAIAEINEKTDLKIELGSAQRQGPSQFSD
jgi:hypothetical protein